MDNFRIEGNTLFVDFEPFNELEEMSRQCHFLLESDYEEIGIYFSDTVFFLGSNYIGVLMMTVEISKIKRKKLNISCTNRLGRMLSVIGGDKLTLDLRDDFVEDATKYTNPYDFIHNNNKKISKD